MPYVITTRTEGRQPGREFDARYSRRAVATLDEVKRYAHSAASELGYSKPEHHDAIEALPESGGTVGPLPDGTTIEVEAVTRQWLWLQLQGFAHGYAPEALAQQDGKLCDAFNAKQDA